MTIKTPRTLALYCNDHELGASEEDDIKFENVKNKKRKCPTCKQTFFETCVMCPGKSRQYAWSEKDTDDRYTDFWNSRAADMAIANAATWDWDTFEQFHKPKGFNKF